MKREYKMPNTILLLTVTMLFFIGGGGSISRTIAAEPRDEWNNIEPVKSDIASHTMKKMDVVSEQGVFLSLFGQDTTHGIIRLYLQPTTSTNKSYRTQFKKSLNVIEPSIGIRFTVNLNPSDRVIRL